ncbi:signal recognition particle-docking protein FtsY [candidate division KSB1 bacterium]
MFKFLKEKLKTAVKKFSKDVDEESEVVEEKVVEKKVKKKPKKKAEPKKKEIKKEKPKKEEKKERPKKEVKKEKPKKKEVKEKPKEEEVVEVPEEKEEIKEEPEEEKEEVEEEPEEEPEDEEPEVEEVKKGFFARMKDKISKKEEPEEEKEEVKEEPEEEPEDEEPEEEKKGFFTRIKETVTTKSLSEDNFEKIFWELEVALLENNVAVEVIEKIKDDLKAKLVQQRFQRGKIEEIISTTLYDSISSLFDVEKIDLQKRIKEKKPLVLAFVGVNGAGKTTTIAKVAKLMQNKGLKPVIAAADTFRAAAIQQLEVHGSNLGIKVIKHDYGSDPAAVAFDAIKYAESKKLDIVLIDTAGRQHSNVNLMDEMKKIIRVAKPDIKIFIGESITGNDCIEQARNFNDAIGIDAIILTKADIDEKGGAAVSVSYVIGKPILFIGMGQEYEDLKEFDKKIILENVGLA